MVDFGLILTYLLIGGAVLACITSPILQLKNYSSKTKNMMVPLVSLIAILIISFLGASNEVLPNYTNSAGLLISPNLSKIVGTALMLFYILSLIAIGSVLYSEFLHKLFQNGKK